MQKCQLAKFPVTIASWMLVAHTVGAAATGRGRRTAAVSAAHGE